MRQEKQTRTGDDINEGSRLCDEHSGQGLGGVCSFSRVESAFSLSTIISYRFVTGVTITSDIVMGTEKIIGMSKHQDGRGYLAAKTQTFSATPAKRSYGVCHSCTRHSENKNYWPKVENWRRATQKANSEKSLKQSLRTVLKGSLLGSSQNVGDAPDVQTSGPSTVQAYPAYPNL
ncbi:uncharacterized protein LY79DRAFT_569544 [Colletotrichum navitas]|uniref:Uncharacterized protein n=1 Tax=Colletotrichum navitas TaxID=681940 RepID=A0AAD8V047_9PEZI|nr:uncharacterized protein LY79DRAFT_569544 [Colletotrichum navitas]KAK1572805.1 hypothetical protein LY79DRAFT_569544 [Colletotrichum navitas]